MQMSNPIGSCNSDNHNHHHHHHQNKKRRKNRLNRNSRIAIIGSGLGGLGAAISLELAGFTDITLYERDVSVDSRREGYGLTLSYNPQGPLAYMGVLEEVAQADCPSRSHYTFASDGRILSYYGNAFRSSTSFGGRGQRGNLRLPRQVLRGILLNKVKSSIQFNKQLTGFQETDIEGRLTLSFHDGSTSPGVDLLIGADGIRSAVVKHLLPNDSGLNYLGIFIILGISDFHHSLLDERGFYTVDGNHRLFTMPYEGSSLSGTKRRIMWQLSYRLENEAEAHRLSTAGPHVLQREVMSRCKDWHEPVVQMVKSTPHDTIWGTGLMDRDPRQLVDTLKNNQTCGRVVVLGDAVHSMSPFKGAGANQALLDGPLLASWLQRASLPSAITGFHREMANRTQPRVLASRQAAAFLHSPAVLLVETAGQDFAGVVKERLPELLQKLKDDGVGAQLGAALDSRVDEAIHGLCCRDMSTEDSSKKDVSNTLLLAQSRALMFASQGNTQGLRTLSLTCPAAVLCARDSRGRTCLHLSVQSGHYHTCKWLLTEVFLAPGIEDDDGVTALQIAGGNEEIVNLLETVSAKTQLVS